MKQEDSLLGVLKTIFKWKKQILWVCVIAGVGSILISLLMSNYYEAKTTFIAVSPDQAKPESLYGTGQLKTEYYGNENDIDRLLTIAESNELINFIIDSFHLYEHYDINPDRPKAAFKVREEFLSLYEVKKTKRDAIQLSVEDKDKTLAAAMANAARNRIGEQARALILSGQNKTINSYQENINNKSRQLEVLSDSLVQIRKRYGIYNLEGQTESLTTQLSETESTLVRNKARLEALKATSGIPRDTIRLLEASVSGIQEEYNNLVKKMALLNDGLSIVGILDRQYIEANQTLSEDKERLKQSLATAQSSIPTLLVVEHAEVPLVKSRPKRSIIVIAACALAFLFSVIGVLLFDTYKKIDWREVYHGE
jgi:tyrosine-protein kinase Etk/Wzc